MFYTYCHTRNDTGKIFYIGKGLKNRAYFKYGRNTHWHRIANKHGFNVEILAYWYTEKEAFDHEKLLISCFKDMGYELANKSDGGEGSFGYCHTEQFKEKLSKDRKGKPSPKKGYKTSEETKKKISFSMMGKVHSIETKEKIAEANRKRIITPETRLKLSIAAKNRELNKKLGIK
jgi:hypothetical protein